MDLESIKKQAMQAAEDFVADFAPWLDFKENDEFLGTISEIRKNPWTEGKFLYEVVDLSSAETFCLRTHTALSSQIEQQDGQVGDYIYIKYLGLTKAKDSNCKYNNYEVGIVKEGNLESEESSKVPGRGKPQ